MAAQRFETAPGIPKPRSGAAVDFDESHQGTDDLDRLPAGSRFPVPDHEGVHPVHDTMTKTYRHLSFFASSSISAICNLQVCQ